MKIKLQKTKYNLKPTTSEPADNTLTVAHSIFTKAPSIFTIAPSHTERKRETPPWKHFHK